MGAKRPNIILIVVDSLRFDDFHRFAKKTLDIARKKGVMFTNATAAGPSTSPSVIAMLTSELPLRCGGYYKVSRRRITIADVLSRYGYKCFCLQTNTFLLKRLGWSKGFHLYEELIPTTTSKIENVIEKFGSVIARTRKVISFLTRILPSHIFKFDKPVYRADYVFERAIDLLSGVKEGAFLYMHLMDVHFPFIPKPVFLRRFLGSINYGRILSANLTWRFEPWSLSNEDIALLRRLYRAEIASLDDALCNFLARLETALNASNLYLVITADHGEEFRDHGGHNHESKLYDELIHVPLLIIGPGLPEGRVVEEPVSLMDLPPTIAHIALGREIRHPKWRGIDLVSFIEESGSLNRLGVMSEVSHKEPWMIDLRYLKVSARSKRWKVIYDAEKNGYEIYDIESDPLERHDLSSSPPKDSELLMLRKMVKMRVTLLSRINRVRGLKKR